VHHEVPRERVTRGYLLRRCWAEGSHPVEDPGAGSPGLLRAFGRHLLDGARGRPRGLDRAAMTAAGAVAVAAGRAVAARNQDRADRAYRGAATEATRHPAPERVPAPDEPGLARRLPEVPFPDPAARPFPFPDPAFPDPAPDPDKRSMA
jgi:hypothetical protein